jgi:hypothetical protein
MSVERRGARMPRAPRTGETDGATGRAAAGGALGRGEVGAAGGHVVTCGRERAHRAGRAAGLPSQVSQGRCPSGGNSSRSRNPSAPRKDRRSPASALIRRWTSDTQTRPVLSAHRMKGLRGSPKGKKGRAPRSCCKPPDHPRRPAVDRIAPAVPLNSGDGRHSLSRTPAHAGRGGGAFPRHPAPPRPASGWNPPTTSRCDARTASRTAPAVISGGGSGCPRHGRCRAPEGRRWAPARRG